VKDAEVHYLTKKQFLPVLDSNPYVDKVYTIEEKVSEVVPELKSENYDHIIDLHKNIRSKQVLSKLNKPSSALNKINVAKWLIVNFKINRLPAIHIVDRYFETTKTLHVKNDEKGLDYFIPEKDEVDLKTLPTNFQYGFIGWVIGGKHNTKIYPAEKIIEICKRNCKPVVLLGGPEDVEKGDEIKNAVGDNVFNACGKFNLNQSASLVKQADKIFTNDTGLMHIAAAFNKEIVSFWGNTIPEFGMYPYMPQFPERSEILEVKNLKCRPCSKIGYNKCPKKHFDCMNKIEIEGI
jgi:ADP-heptose:LPS heptosyltransferase